MHNYIDNAAKKIIIAIDRISPEGNLTKNFYTKNKNIILSIKPDAPTSDKFFNCKTHEFTDSVDLSNSNGIIFPLIPFEITPNSIFNTDANENDYYQFQEKLINFFHKEFNRIKNNIHINQNNINTLNFIKSHSFFSSKIFNNDFEYISSFIENTVAEEYIGKFLSFISEYMDINDNLKKETDIFAKLRLFYKLKIKESVDKKIEDIEKEKIFSLEQAKSENMPFIEGEIINHYNEKLKLIRDNNYSKFIDFFDNFFDLVKFWPSWLEAPEFIDKNQCYDVYRCRLFACIKLLDAKVSLNSSPEYLVQEGYKMKLNLLNNHKNNILKEITEILASDDSIEELKALKDIITTTDLQKLLDDHLGKIDDLTNAYTFFEMMNFWPDILQPEPAILEELRIVLSGNNDIIFLS